MDSKIVIGMLQHKIGRYCCSSIAFNQFHLGDEGLMSEFYGSSLNKNTGGPYSENRSGEVKKL
jgi:hypothetical protein